MAAAAILDLIEPEIVPFDLLSPKSPSWNQKTKTKMK